MTKIDNPENTKEVRGYVMIMLQRADEDGATTNVCKDPLIMLACALDSDDCPAQCKEGRKDGEDPENPYYEVKAGDLNVALKSAKESSSSWE